MLPNPFLDPDFHIRWSRLAPELIGPAMESAITDARAAIEEIATRDIGSLNYENTFLALEHSTEDLNVAWGKVSHLQSVADSPPLRSAYNSVLPKIAAFQAGIPLNAALWRRLKSFYESPAAREVTGIHRRFMDETVTDFRRAGADLPEPDRTRLEALQAELAQLTQKYAENVLDSTNAWQLVVEDEGRLAGLPGHAKEAARRSASAKGMSGWRFTLHMPSQEPFMTYADDEALRREMWTAASRVGAAIPQDNALLIGRILALRAEKARLLGKPNFADLVLERRMAKSASRALDFIEGLRTRAAAGFERETRELEEFKARSTGRSRGRLAPWDIPYWAEKLRRASYDFDEESLRPYFPMNRVASGLFEIARRVFGLDIVARGRGEVETWHTEVDAYDLFDSQHRHLGSFYADWHPREAKRGGAWMNYLITGGPRPDGTRAPHLGLICGNLTPSADDHPSLLTHREVLTIFHEFGHLLHHLLGEVEVKSLNGVNVVWDFVELPSQIMENWCWDRQGLDLFAAHYQTGAAIPEELFGKMTAARNFRSASTIMRQLAFAKMDLLLHTRAGEFAALPDAEPRIRAEIAGFLVPTDPPAPTIVKRFTHVFADPVGYAAGYYSYKWAEVLDADAFTRFQREGIFNRAVGKDFVDKILSRGNSAEAGELYRAFMGRDPDLDALLQRSGLASAA